MSKWDGINRRKFPRVNYPCLVVIRNDGTLGNDVILTHTENVGIGGVCVTLKKNVRLFSPVELELDLLDLGNHIKCSGKVVWNIQRRIDAAKKPLFYDVGIEFEDITPEDRERLVKVVRHLVKENQIAA